MKVQLDELREEAKGRLRPANKTFIKGNYIENSTNTSRFETVT